jgi:hypothetical protein
MHLWQTGNCRHGACWFRLAAAVAGVAAIDPRGAMLSTVVVANDSAISIGVASWWMSLCLVAAVNVAAWSWSAAALQRSSSSLTVESLAASRMQLMLSGVYVFGCAFRSVLPVYDIPRLGLFDTWWSSVVVGRSVATVAELAFASQWALLLYATARAAQSHFARSVSLLLVPLIALAETCSWYAVLTTTNLAHVAENSTWALSALLVTAAMLAILPRCAPSSRRVLFAWCMAGIAYVAFMACFDVPTYWARHLADEAIGRHYMTLAQGLADVSHRRVVSYRWEDWRTEVVWMTLYFSVAVWFSISMVNARIPLMRVTDGKAKIRVAATTS